jgi:hypothetical protein
MKSTNKREAKFTEKLNQSTDNSETKKEAFQSIKEY